MNLLSSSVTRFLYRVIESEWKWLFIYSQPLDVAFISDFIGDMSKYILSGKQNIY